MHSCSALPKLAYFSVRGSLEDCVADTSCRTNLNASQSLDLNQWVSEYTLGVLGSSFAPFLGFDSVMKGCLMCLLSRAISYPAGFFGLISLLLHNVNVAVLFWDTSRFVQVSYLQEKVCSSFISASYNILFAIVIVPFVYQEKNTFCCVFGFVFCSLLLLLVCLGFFACFYCDLSMDDYFY